MRNDGHTSLDQNLISARVIEMIVTVDCVLDRFVGELLNLGDQLFDCRGSKERVEYHDTVIADDEACVARGKSTRLRNRGVDAVGNLDDRKIVFRLSSSGRSQQSGIECRSESDCQQEEQ